MKCVFIPKKFGFVIYSVLPLWPNIKTEKMEHTKSGVVQPKMYKEFHVVYFIARQFPPIVTSQNIHAISLLEALEYFIEVNPNLANDILYITQKI